MVSDELIESNKKVQLVFKNSNFQKVFRSISITGKKKNWKSLKQVLAQERSLPWPADTACCRFHLIFLKMNI